MDRYKIILIVSNEKGKGNKAGDVKGIIENLELSKERSGRASWRW